jgi:hypothetical protein
VNLYLISQSANDGYDTYSDAVVAAADEDSARKISPGSYIWSDAENCWMFKYADGTISKDSHSSDWVDDLNLITVKMIGRAVKGTQPGCILSSFYAG